MHCFRYRAGLLLLALLLLLCPVAHASGDGGEESNAKASIEKFLRSYAEEALLYTNTDQRMGSVTDPALSLSGENPVFTISGEETDLARMKENIAFVEKKAAFCAAARQMQDIYREDLELTYTYRKLDLGENTGSASVVENAGFRYTDSDRRSVYETIYSVDLVKLDGQWLVAGATDGSKFDSDHPVEAGFDAKTELEALRAALETEHCTVTYPLSQAGTGGIPYRGEQAAAYAYTYARQRAGQPRKEFYSPRFESYAGKGGDCMNFASQCMWAGFGGSETASAIDGHASPMDAAGEYLWFGRGPADSRGPAAGEDVKYALGWLSCQSFRRYLTGTKDGWGTAGSNAGGEAGMYATILHVSGAAPLSGVPAEDLVGAVAHVEGAGGPHAHAIVLTAATGNRRSEIWFCSHTKDMTHIKLGDYYWDSIKVYIPRYLRADTPGVIRPGRIPPVAAGGSAQVGFHCEKARDSLTVTVTAPGESAGTSRSAANADACAMEFQFETPGLYRVDCAARTGEAVSRVTYYVRCVESGGEEPDIPAWLLSGEEREAALHNAAA